MLPELEKMIEAAQISGKIIKGYFGQILEVTEKTSAIDLKTQADTESEAQIIDVLEKAFPTHGIYSEEAGELVKNSDYRFIIDPLDGTHNFTLGIPYFSVSIALAKGTQILAGVVYNPILEYLYYAEKGQSAWFDRVKLKVSDVDSKPKELTVAYVSGYETYRQDKTIFINLINNTARTLLSCSPALDLCLLASGKIGAVVYNNTNIHDFAAGKLIALEAGAKVTDLAGKKETDQLNSLFVISNGTSLHEELLKIITSR